MTSVPVRTPKSPPRGISFRYDLPQIANISLWNLWSFQKARGIFGLLVGLERHRLEGAFSSLLQDLAQRDGMELNDGQAGTIHFIYNMAKLATMNTKECRRRSQPSSVIMTFVYIPSCTL
jgi:hypothetical protein